MVTENDLLQAIRVFLAGNRDVASLLRLAREAVADHAQALGSATGQLALEMSVLCDELSDAAVSPQDFRRELQALAGPQLVQASARLPGAYSAVATGTSAPLTTIEYQAPAAE
jgi:hypothetical protein